MTRTTQIEWHGDRPMIHFGSPAGDTYWKRPEPEPRPKTKKKRKKAKK